MNTSSRMKTVDKNFKDGIHKKTKKGTHQKGRRGKGTLRCKMVREGERCRFQV